MKNWKQTRGQIEALIATGDKLYIVSGEGENGSRAVYNGKKSVLAIQRRLAAEKCNGERWARLDTESNHALAGIF